MYGGRGIARYVADQAAAVEAAAPELVRAFLLNPRYTMPAGGGAAAWPTERVRWARRLDPDLLRGPLVYHVMSPFEMAVPTAEVWPLRGAPDRACSWWSTLFDLIPLIFPTATWPSRRPRARFLARGASACGRRTRAGDVARPPPRRDGLLRPARAHHRDRRRVSTRSSGRRRARRTRSARSCAPATRSLREGTCSTRAAIEFRKNIERLIEAYGAMRAALRARHQLVITCKVLPDERARLDAGGGRGGAAEGEILITGYVPDSELAALYRLTRLFVFPSFYEGFGLPMPRRCRAGRPWSPPRSPRCRSSSASRRRCLPTRATRRRSPTSSCAGRPTRVPRSLRAGRRAPGSASPGGARRRPHSRPTGAPASAAPRAAHRPAARDRDALPAQSCRHGRVLQREPDVVTSGRLVRRRPASSRRARRLRERRSSSRTRLSAPRRSSAATSWSALRRIVYCMGNSGQPRVRAARRCDRCRATSSPTTCAWRASTSGAPAAAAPRWPSACRRVLTGGGSPELEGAARAADEGPSASASGCSASVSASADRRAGALALAPATSCGLEAEGRRRAGRRASRLPFGFPTPPPGRAGWTPGLRTSDGLLRPGGRGARGSTALVARDARRCWSATRAPR